jgi:8-oxo-dGTP diphosphatase
MCDSCILPPTNLILVEYQTIAVLARPLGAVMSSESRIELIARGVLITDSRVLLCRNVKHGYYFLPGGHVEFGEPAASALARELLEECGLPVSVGACVLVTEGFFLTGRKPHHEMNVVFHVERAGSDQDIASREPAISFEWVDLVSVPDMDIRPLAVRAWLASGGSRPVEEAGVVWVSEIAPTSSP